VRLVKPRIGFVMEQTLGHVAYGMGLRDALADRSDFEARWIDVPYQPEREPLLPVVGKNWTLRGSLRAARAVRAELKREPLDALFVHTQTIALFLGPVMRKVPTLFSTDATPLNYDTLATHYGDRVHAAPVERAKLAAHRAIVRRARSFTAWSEWAKTSLVSDYGADASLVTVIHPGTVLSRFPPPREGVARREGPLRVLFVGGDFKRKGGDVLLEARRRMKNAAELHLVTGAEVPDEKGVHVYRGIKPLSPELLRLYADADAFVLPTRGDCLAVVLGEAMAACLPIITTAVGAHAEAVENERSGYIVPTDDAAAVADRLDRLASDPELARRLGMRARAVGEERFDMKKNANRIADLLLETCARGWRAA
jgi:glycosyltransferase involved in cell wall biosynthesis